MFVPGPRASGREDMRLKGNTAVLVGQIPVPVFSSIHVPANRSVEKPRIE